MENTKKEILDQIKKEIEEETSDRALDFVSDYSLENNANDYLCDMFNEFADNNTSIYYSNQRKYFNEHSTECEDALLEFYDGDSIAEKIKKNGLDSLLCLAGSLGEYEAIYSELSQDEENIKKLLVIRYLLKNDFFAFPDRESIEELLSEAESCDDMRDLNAITQQFMADMLEE